MLTGKVQRYVSASQWADYGLVRERILQAYDLVPQAYHQKFRNLVKKGGQIYAKNVSEKENAFDGWVISMKVDEYDKLKQLV